MEANTLPAGRSETRADEGLEGSEGGQQRRTLLWLGDASGTSWITQQLGFPDLHEI